MNARNSKAPGFLAARASLYAVGAASAVFGLAGSILPELPMTWDHLPFAALILATMTGLSAFVVPTTIEIVGRAFWSGFLIPAALVFGGINAYSFHHAVEVLIEEPRQEEYRAGIAPKTAALEAAKDAVVNHAVPVFPDTMGPKNIGARMDAWDRAHAPLVAAQSLAQKEVDALPPYAPLVPQAAVWAIAAAIDISLAFGLAGISLVRTRIGEKVKAERQAAKAAAQKAKAKVGRKTAAKSPVTTAEQALLNRARGAHLTVVRT